MLEFHSFTETKFPQYVKIVVEREDTYTVLQPDEQRIDSLLAPSFKSEVVNASSYGARNLIIDLSAVHYIDSSGLSAILVADRLCKSNGGTFVLTGLQPPVRKLVDISHLDGVLVILPTLLEAKDYVNMEEVERELKGDSNA